MANVSIDASEQNVLYDIDQAYWLVVSLKQKQRLAESYLKLVKKLDEDVNKMIKEGVATRADGLKVDVKVNEAEKDSITSDGVYLFLSVIDPDDSIRKSRIVNRYLNKQCKTVFGEIIDSTYPVFKKYDVILFLNKSL